MTPQEHIAYLRTTFCNDATRVTVDAVCDMAERALLTDDDCNAIRDDLAGRCGSAMTPRSRAVLRRLLPAGPVEHRLTITVTDSEREAMRFGVRHHETDPARNALIRDVMQRIVKETE